MTRNTSNQLTLEFGYTHHSPNYEMIVNLARDISTYSTEGIGKRIRHRVLLKEYEEEKWLELLSYVSSWKTSRVYSESDRNIPIHLVKMSLQCYIKRLSRIDKESYCFKNNWIGCIRIRQGRYLNVDEDCGNFLDEDRFQTHKEGIIQSIENHKGYHLMLCPAFSISRVQQKIRELPSVIELIGNTEWTTMSDYNSSGRRLLYGIRYIRYQEGLLVGDEDSEYCEHSESEFVYEYKVIIINHNDWVEAATDGEIPQLNKYGKYGWLLKSVFHIDDQWHCIMCREKWNSLN